MRLIDIIMRIITIAAMIGLLGSYTAPYVDPNIFYPSSLLGLAYHYQLITNIILLLYWIARWKKMAFLSLIIIASGYPFITTYYGLNSTASPDASHDLTLMTYNIRMLDAYGWSREKNAPQRIVDYINDSNNDIVCMQEFPRQEVSSKKFPSYPYYHQNRDVTLISRYPIVNKGIITFEKENSATCLYCDIAVGKDTIRVYTVHLESFRLGKNEQQIYKELTSGNTQNATEGVITISSRLVRANRNRAKQATTIKNHMQQSPYPVIICGDFNDTPISFTYHTLSSNMKDSFIEKGRGLGNTYIGEFPSFRIDHVLHSPLLKSISYSRDTVEFSDHYPVQTNLKFNRIHHGLAK